MGIQLTVLGFGSTWRGFNWKFKLVRDYLRDRPVDSLVAFVDAYDVLVLQNATEIRRRYETLTGGDYDRIVFGLDNPTRDPFLGATSRIAFPVCHGRYVVNSGVYMGTAGRIRALLSQMPTQEYRQDDQKLLNGLCRDRPGWFRRYVTLDVGGRLIFTTICRNYLRYFVGGGHCGNGFTLLPGDLRSPLTGNVPCFIHAPGALNMDPFCKVLGLPMGRRRPRVRWIWGNWWRELVLCLLTFCLVLSWSLRLLACYHRRTTTVR